MADRPEGGAGPEVTRRHVLHGAALTGLAVPLLAACGSDQAGAPQENGTDAGGGSGGADGASVAAADVPVGGGAILTDAKVVVTQPAEGDYKAFTAVCTHQGCIVDTVADGTINCPCHGSMFSIEDGSVVGGPAPRPLAAKEVTVEGDQITVT